MLEMLPSKMILNGEIALSYNSLPVLVEKSIMVSGDSWPGVREKMGGGMGGAGISPAGAPPRRARIVAWAAARSLAITRRAASESARSVAAIVVRRRVAAIAVSLSVWDCASMRAAAALAASALAVAARAALVAAMIWRRSSAIASSSMLRCDLVETGMLKVDRWTMKKNF